LAWLDAGQEHACLAGLEFGPSGVRRSRCRLLWRARTSRRLVGDHLKAEVTRLALRAKKFDRDVAERSIGVVARHVGKAAARKACFAIRELQMHLLPARNSAGDLRVADRDIDIIAVVLVQQR